MGDGPLAAGLGRVPPRRYARPVTDAPPRYRCTRCGNLTRFDVTSTRRTRAFHHYSVGGELQIEDVDVLEETVESVESNQV